MSSFYGGSGGGGGAALDVTYVVVKALPTKDIKENVTYLILKEAGAQEENNKYTEYKYIAGSWEVVGDNFQLDRYYTKEQILDLLENKQDSLIAGSNITIKGNVISSNAAGKIAINDEIFTADSQGVINLSTAIVPEVHVGDSAPTEEGVVVWLDTSDEGNDVYTKDEIDDIVGSIGSTLDAIIGEEI